MLINFISANRPEKLDSSVYDIFPLSLIWRTGNQSSCSGKDPQSWLIRVIPRTCVASFLSGIIGYKSILYPWEHCRMLSILLEESIFQRIKPTHWRANLRHGERRLEGMGSGKGVKKERKLERVRKKENRPERPGFLWTFDKPSISAWNQHTSGLFSYRSKDTLLFLQLDEVVILSPWKRTILLVNYTSIKLEGEIWFTIF